ncbi:hypothetical protein SLE2022_346940 [Rubroshorea leprosula]
MAGLSSSVASLCCMLVVFFLSASAEFRRFEHPPKPDGSLSFLVIGDWGRRGTYNQSEVAVQMGSMGEKLSIDFVVSTGDNFYENGLRGIHDPAFLYSFTDIYTAKSLQKQWYAVLGNHDYGGNAKAQLSTILRRTDRRWLCLRSYIVNTGTAEIFFVDTTPFVDKYFEKTKHHKYDWRGVLPREKYLTKLLKDLESALKLSVASWKIVIGHHTIRSIGHHGETRELVTRILPILEANDVDLYINGHDHCLQHISSNTSSMQFLTSGGGSKAWKGDYHDLNQEGLKFYYDGQGFMSLQLNPTNAKIVFYDIAGKVLHSTNLSKQRYSVVM